jgi:hypothetical protein
MKIESVLKYFKDNKINFEYADGFYYKLKKGYTLLIDGESYSYYSENDGELTFFEYEFNLETSKDAEHDILLKYHGKDLKYIVDRFIL